MTPSLPTEPASPHARRDEKLEAFRTGERRRVRVRRIAIASGIVAAIAIVSIVVVSIVVTSRPEPSGPSSGIRGLQTFSNTAEHVQGPVTYDQTPPAGGPHNPTWLNCGIYTEPVPNENAVHDLEHGAVWVTYDPSLPAAEVAKLRDLMPSTYTVLSPYPGLPAKIVLSAWNAQVTVSSVTDARIAQFFEKYWKSANAPEPGAPCTGGLDAPGKL
ncbi:DUF3105 domain-containing protein [Lacisediminihabitans sp. FW035]